MAKDSTTFERRQRLLTLLHDQPGVRVAEIARTLNVSEGTVRNDLNALAADDRLTRVRGGAVLADEARLHSPAFATRSRLNQVAKLQIARRAAELVQEGDSILLDASTTVYHMARFLQTCQNLTVVTNGIEVARALAQNRSNTVIVLGGVLDPDGISIQGTLSEPFLKDLHIKTAFVSCSGFTLEAGLTEVSLHEAQLKSKMIASASAVVALIDSTKFGRLDLKPFARLDQVSRLLTDSSLGARWVKRLQRAGAVVTICEADDAGSVSMAR